MVVVDQRTAKTNRLRCLASALALVALKELLHLKSVIPLRIEDQENGLSERFGQRFRRPRRALQNLDERIGELDRENRR